MNTATSTWPGQWVHDQLDLELTTTSGIVDVRDLVGLAVRRNPKRAHLLVSSVLGKHVPVDPRLVLAAGWALGERVHEQLTDQPASTDLVPSFLRALAGATPAATRPQGSGCEDVVVLGYAETATALGHLVADVLAAPYLHSTRRPVPGVPSAAGFDEAHSHATGHLLSPADRALLTSLSTLVLVDDELTTGNTALATIEALDALHHRDRYVVATLVDMRTPDDARRLQDAATRLGTRIDVVSLAAGAVSIPGDILERAARLLDAHPNTPASAHPAAASAVRVDVPWPVYVPETGRHGFSPAHRRTLDAHGTQLAAPLLQALQAPTGQVPATVHVLGTEELMDAPLRIAAALADLAPQSRVTFSSTTRSPVLALDADGYALRDVLTFDAHDDPADGPGLRYAYNVGRPDAVVVITDTAGDSPQLTAPTGLLAQLNARSGNVVLVALPDTAAALAAAGGLQFAGQAPLRGPAFGSYAAAEVGWLLTDLSDVKLEAPVEEREEAIQSGGAHYAESLPVEYQPSASYQELFETALASTARRMAVAVGAVTEQVIASRAGNPVLVSLARAGTPVGVLMRRWAAFRHGVELDHYAVSIVRGRGIDAAALTYLAERYDPSDVVFVDGWTGKGAIARELDAALEAHAQATGVRFNSELAVLADPGRCTSLFGTRDDFLIPSACLNSTVSGLVSRTVLNTDVLEPGQFHGAKFYRELAPFDRSNALLDAITAEFANVGDEVTELLATPTDREVDWAGWRCVEEISEAYGIGDVNLVKPGVGETTRVLLRRVPWKVLVHPDAAPSDVAHLRALAAERSVPVEEDPSLRYSCIGLIHPKYTRGATGSAGTSVVTA